MKKVNLAARLRQVNGAEVTPAENVEAPMAKPLHEQPVQQLSAPPAPVLPPAPAPEAVKTPEGFDQIFEMAMKVRTGKPGMADFWARMAQAEALNRLATSFERFNEFMGVFDNDDHPDQDSVRFSDVLTFVEEAKEKS
jgi:hypothetical protein